ncbi:FxsA family protein [Streptosporangium sp. NBC_01810]|uniref:FxsA family protein n=1 Tax=Streptosporangium sp. NBC_01810 TaxID=2975951 RepID=UPI002DD873C9|nr:FxsA family protein [Streptosporangium sp. NBC_01810]WSA29047.1 FxsA family protein [Streptosporangium sp. NBC_01810]
MRFLLVLTFLVVPVLEMLVLIQVGQVIGGWPTLALLLAGGLLGSWIVRREGRRAWRNLQSALQTGRMPDRELAGGGLIIVGGTLLLIPGFLSDVLGVLCLLPFTRPMVRRLGAWFFARRVRTVMARNAAGAGLGSPFGGDGSPFDVLRDAGRSPGSGPVLHGEVIRDEPAAPGGAGAPDGAVGPRGLTDR